MNNIYGGYYPFEINYEAEEKKRQKKSLKSTSNKVGLFVTAYFLSMYLISIVLIRLEGSQRNSENLGRLPGIRYRFSFVDRDFPVVLGDKVPQDSDGAAVLILQAEPFRFERCREENTRRDVEFSFEAHSLQCASLHDFPFLWLKIMQHPQGRTGHGASALFGKYAPGRRKIFRKAGNRDCNMTRAEVPLRNKSKPQKGGLGLFSLTEIDYICVR